WVTAYRERLREKQFDVLNLLVARYLERGDSARALDYAERSYHFDPWREDALCKVMRLRNARGDRAGAVAEYLAFRRRVREELGVDPLPQTTALYAQLCEPAGASATAVAAAEEPVTWHGGSPYCGLRAFDREHTPV